MWLSVATVVSSWQENDVLCEICCENDERSVWRCHFVSNCSACSLVTLESWCSWENSWCKEVEKQVTTGTVVLRFSNRRVCDLTWFCWVHNHIYVNGESENYSAMKVKMLRWAGMRWNNFQMSVSPRKENRKLHQARKISLDLGGNRSDDLRIWSSVAQPTRYDAKREQNDDLRIWSSVRLNWRGTTPGTGASRVW